MKTGTEIFNEALKKTIEARQTLREVQKTLKNMSRAQIKQLENESPEMFEALLGTVTEAIVDLEDWGEPDDVFNYELEVKTFDKEIGKFKPLGIVEWDDEGYYNNEDDDEFEEKYFGYDQEVFVYLQRDGKIQVEAFGDIEEFNRGEYKQVRKFINKAFKDEGYEDF